MQHIIATYYAQTLLPETPVNTTTAPQTPVITPPARITSSQDNSSAVMDTSNSNTPIITATQDRQVDVPTPCTRQNDMLVDPQVDPYDQVP